MSFVDHCRGCECEHAIAYEILYVINKYFKWARSLHAVDDDFDHSVRWYWFECVEFKEQGHVTMNHRGYRDSSTTLVLDAFECFCF